MIEVNNKFNIGDEVYTIAPMSNCAAATTKVRIKRIVVSIWKDVQTIKYKVDPLDYWQNIRNRNESTLFATIEEAEIYCKEVNQKEKQAEF